MAALSHRNYLDFERPVAELEAKIEELEALDSEEGPGVAEEVSKLREKAREQLTSLYERLDAWQKTQVARHPDRPHFEDYRAALIDEFTELSGDRRYAAELPTVL